MGMCPNVTCARERSHRRRLPLEQEARRDGGDAQGKTGLGGAGGLAAPCPNTGSLTGPHVLPHRVRAPLRLCPPLWGQRSTPAPLLGLLHHVPMGLQRAWRTEEGSPWMHLLLPGSPQHPPSVCQHRAHAGGWHGGCAATSPGAKKRRAATPKVPHPWDGAERTLVPLRTACCLSVPALHGGGQEQRGGFGAPLTGADPSVGAQQLWAGRGLVR